MTTKDEVLKTKYSELISLYPEENFSLDKDSNFETCHKKYENDVDLIINKQNSCRFKLFILCICGVVEYFSKFKLGSNFFHGFVGNQCEKIERYNPYIESLAKDSIRYCSYIPNIVCVIFHLILDLVIMRCIAFIFRGAEFKTSPSLSNIIDDYIHPLIITKEPSDEYSEISKVPKRQIKRNPVFLFENFIEHFLHEENSERCTGCDYSTGPCGK